MGEVSPQDQVTLMRLRVELYAAAQLLRDEAFAELAALVREVQMVFFDPKEPTK